MPNALTSVNGTRVFTGARAIFYFNGEPVGFASGCGGGEEIGYEPIDTLDHLEVREHVPTSYRVTFTAAVFRTIAKGESSNAKDAPGSLKQQNIFPKFEQILKLDGVDAAIIDEVTGKTIFLLREVKCSSYNFNITARSTVAQNLTFVAIRAYDEDDVSGALNAA